MRRAAVAVVIVCLPIIAGVALASDSAHRSRPKTVTLLGNSHVTSKVGRQRAGSAEIFPFVSHKSGTATAVRIYVDRRNRSTKLFVGVYLYRNGHPDRRLRYGKLSRPRAGHWNSVKISRVIIRAGHRYGISVLGRGGALYFRNRTGKSCRGAQANQLTVKALPASWGASRRRSACAISAYVVGKGDFDANPPTLPPAGAPSGSPAPSGSSAAVVGSAGEPAVTCSTTLNPGASVQSALAAASPGGVVCLNAGNWGRQTLSGLSPASPGVTLAAAPGAIGQVSVAGITTNGTVNNLTVEGLTLTGGVFILSGATNDTFRFNTMEGWGGEDAQSDSAFLIFPGESGASDGSATGISMVYNQIDNVPQCLEDNSNGGNTFSHNVCGPGIGYGGSTDQHYIQAEGLPSGETIDNNAFEGPLAPGAVNNGSHTNVLHACGPSLQFDNNIVWETQALAQTLLWGDDCQTTNSEANNNLFVESSSPATYSMWIDNAHSSSNVTFSNDTAVNPTSYGAFYNEISSFHAHKNVAAGPNGYAGFTNCDCSNNAADDRSGSLNWTPAWQNTTWTPNAGSPWNPPPANYYKPAGIASTYGYQGTIGP